MLSSGVRARLVQFHMSRIMLENHIITLLIKDVAFRLSDVCVLKFLESFCYYVYLKILQNMVILVTIFHSCLSS